MNRSSYTVLLEKKRKQGGGEKDKKEVSLEYYMSEHGLLFGYHHISCLEKNKKTFYSNSIYL